MKMGIIVRKPSGITAKEEKNIQLNIDNSIEKCKESRVELAKHSSECLALSTATESRAKFLYQQGSVTRVWNSFTGKNHNLHAANSKDLAKSQYAATKMIVHLAEQNAMTMEVTAIMGNRISYIAQELNTKSKQIINLAQDLQKLTAGVKSHLAEHGKRIDKLERNQDLFFWKETIEDRIFEGTCFSELNDIQKIICLASDFYQISRGSWMYHDIIFLRSVLRELGIDTKSSINLNQFFMEFTKQPALFAKIFTENKLEGRQLESPVHSPVLFGIIKLQLLQGEEKYLLDFFHDELQNHGVEKNIQDLQTHLTSKHLLQFAMASTFSEISIFNLTLELLSGMEILSNNPVADATLQNSIKGHGNDNRTENSAFEYLHKKHNQIKLELGLQKEINVQREAEINSINNILKTHSTFDRKIVLIGNALGYMGQDTSCLPLKAKITWRKPDKSKILNSSDSLFVVDSFKEDGTKYGANCSESLATIFKLVPDGVYPMDTILGVLSSQNDSVKAIEQWLTIHNLKEKISCYINKEKSFPSFFDKDQFFIMA
jgi:hypothetical protein